MVLEQLSNTLVHVRLRLVLEHLSDLTVRRHGSVRLPRLAENTKLEFSGDLLNISNRVYLGNVTGTLSSTTFGKASTSESARRVLLGIRINF